jgi:hypothetical protein
VADLPGRRAARGQHGGSTGDGVLLGMLAHAGVAQHHLIRQYPDAERHRVADRGTRGRRAGGGATAEAEEIDRAGAPGQQETRQHQRGDDPHS